MAAARLTVLVENTAQGHGLLAEHGIAFWIEVGSRRVLFDAGQSEILAHNADLLGIDLGSADAVVLSHGHYDHTGGLGVALQDTGRRRVFAHPEVLSGKYVRNPDGSGRDIGIPASVRGMLRQTADMIPADAPLEVCAGLCVTGPIPRITDFEDIGGPFFKDTDCRQPDDLVDDQAAYLDTPAGTVVVLGCAHAGIVNTLTYIRELNHGRPAHTVIGGTHLVAADETRMSRTIGALREFGVERLFPVHCTGFAAAARLWEAFPGRVFSCPVGTVLGL